ncbi:hypothetical protein VL20_5508 [Microcystis panniformis FACHB-1757]|uniref:Uncharacterized protein n=1 Tax=Microcystis panniformis FACHB-1757 TaxID=1638788 RepID=A0A0K1S874_9CHRO|nr:hypothetical protein VL20_5508 [Microcystis panniformis FACHB-1757]
MGIKVKTPEFGIGENPYIILVCQPDFFPVAKERKNDRGA